MSKIVSEEASLHHLEADDTQKISSKYIYILFLSKKRFEFDKNGIISGEKMRYSGNYNYDYAHSFFGKDF